MRLSGLLIVPLVLCSARAEGATISYSLAFGDYDQSASLIDSVGAGIAVVLIDLGRRAIHSATTGATYRLDPQDPWSFVPTRLTGATLQPSARALGVLGVNPDQVEIVAPTLTPARENGDFVGVVFDSLQAGAPLLNSRGYTLVTAANSIPRILTVGSASLVIYPLALDTAPQEIIPDGPSFLHFRNTIVRLSRYCTADYVFFLQQGELHLVLAEVGCEWGEYNVCIYSLSGEAPVLVYIEMRLGT